MTSQLRLPTNSAQDKLSIRFMTSVWGSLKITIGLGLVLSSLALVFTLLIRGYFAI